eukprot:jgi/Tetstr1/432737/TSEL_022103.t1
MTATCMVGERLTALEFYSGIGGLHYGLRAAAPGAAVLAAFDLHATANEAYAANLGLRPQQLNIGGIPPAKLAAYAADVWLLSPPCQPYTRKGLQKDSDDGRATSFLQVLELLPSLQPRPSYLLVENVVGFECSRTRDALLATLHSAGYAVQEFILSPLQLGVPYSRPRYFCLAKAAPLAFVAPARPGSPPRQCVPTSLLPSAPPSSGTSQPPRPVRDFLVDDPAAEWGGAAPLRQHPPDPEDMPASRYAAELGDPATDTSSSGAADGSDPWAVYRVPEHVIEQSGFVLDVVAAPAVRLKCFTKTYSRFAKGTGSVLATAGAERLREYRSDNGGCGGPPPGDAGAAAGGVAVADGWAAGNYGEAVFGASLKELGLRYFTPREVANLHSFPPSFAFPPGITLRQRYALLGNSLSVAVVADLLTYLLAEPAGEAAQPGGAHKGRPLGTGTPQLTPQHVLM